MNDNDNGDSAKKRARAVTMMNDHGKVTLLIRTVILFDLFHLSMLGPQYSFKLTTIFCKFCKFWRHRIGNVQILSWKGLGMTFLSYFHFFLKKLLILPCQQPVVPCRLLDPHHMPQIRGEGPQSLRNPIRSWNGPSIRQATGWPQVRTVPSCFSAANAKAVPHISYMPTSLDNVGWGQDEGCTACTPLWTKNSHSKCNIM